MNSGVDTIERMKIIRDFRLGEFDVLIGINLLREGLDIPEVSLVAILDADKEGFLRSETSLIQTIGRAARNENGKVILYADEVTGSMEKAITETLRRRTIQMNYNKKHGIVPKTIKKSVRDVIEISQNKEMDTVIDNRKIDKKEIRTLIDKLSVEMNDAAQMLNFEYAIQIRNKIDELKKMIDKK